MGKINVALVEAGPVGEMHAYNIINSIAEIHLAAVVDQKLDRKWVNAMGIPFATRDIDRVLDKQDIHAIVIADASNTHCKVIERAARAGKSIFCEKPIVSDLKTIERIERCVRDADVQLQVGYNGRFDPDFTLAKKKIESGAIGEPQITRITNSYPRYSDHDWLTSSARMFMDFHLHDFDMARYVNQRNIKSVYATSSVVDAPSMRGLDNIDTTVITLQMHGGALCVINSSTHNEESFDQRIEIYGSKDMLQVENKLSVYSDGASHRFAQYNVASRIEQLKMFARCVNKQYAPCVTVRDAYHAVAAAKAAQRSIAENRIVELKEIESAIPTLTRIVA